MKRATLYGPGEWRLTVTIFDPLPGRNLKIRVYVDEKLELTFDGTSPDSPHADVPEKGDLAGRVAVRCSNSVHCEPGEIEARARAFYEDAFGHDEIATGLEFSAKRESA